ncbi:regulator of microtubule dynamics protein 1 [Clupea harengus]|uniref:Regulator of microtubule dynamics protein 1 n=1 Tax=Clupea harengus TaxID=7950 RepID=A0A6P3VRU1_CLUHA|nr:regulator of microtubule dynamics protein 1 [Clupea harengus]
MATTSLLQSVARVFFTVSRSARSARTKRSLTIRGQTATAGGGVWLLSVPAVCYLGSELYQRLRRAATVHALSPVEAVLEQADYLYSCGDTEKLHQLLLQYKSSDDAEFLWRLARACRDLSLLSHVGAEQKKQLTYEALEYASRALEKNDACFAAHKWYAVCLSDVGDYEGVKVKIGNSYIIKEHLERAVELNPKDATSLHILGYWCYAFAELPWYQRKVAAMIFASPPTATFEEALVFFQKAEEVDPNFYSKNLLMMGKSYMMLKDNGQAVAWLTRAQDYVPRTEEDKQVHKEAVDLLKKLNA